MVYDDIQLREIRKDAIKLCCEMCPLANQCDGYEYSPIQCLLGEEKHNAIIDNYVRMATDDEYYIKVILRLGKYFG